MVGVSQCQQPGCPPPVGQFITLNGQPYRATSTAVIKARKERRAVVARLGVNDNQFYNSPQCSVLEDAGSDLYSNFGVREEYDPVTFSRSKAGYTVSSCQGPGQLSPQFELRPEENLLQITHSDSYPYIATNPQTSLLTFSMLKLKYLSFSTYK